MTTNAITTISPPSMPSLSEVETLKEICKVAAYSGFLTTNSTDPTRRMSDAFFVAMYGRELGIPPMTALRNIYVIDGKPSCSGQLLLGLMRRAGVEVDIPDPATITTEATVRVRRPGDEWHAYTYTEAMAQKAGLLNRGPWGKHRAEMLIWRAVGIASRMETPDLAGGLYTVEELSETDVNENGEPVGPIIVRRDTPAPVEVPNGAASGLAFEAPAPDTAAPQAQGRVIETRLNKGTANRLPPRTAPPPPATTEAPRWNNPDNVMAMLDYVRLDIPDITNSEIAALMGLADATAPAAWASYESGKAAAKAVVAAWEAALRPATPTQKPAVWTDAAIDEIETWLANSFDRPYADALAACDKAAWTDFANPGAAQTALIARAQQQQWPVVATAVTYRVSGSAKYLLFHTALGDVRAYGRSTGFKAMVGDAYYAANGFEALDDGSRHEIAPLRLVWSQKDSYRVVKSATPVLDEQGLPTDPAARENHFLGAPAADAVPM